MFCQFPWHFIMPLRPEALCSQVVHPSVHPLVCPSETSQYTVTALSRRRDIIQHIALIFSPTRVIWSNDPGRAEIMFVRLHINTLNNQTHTISFIRPSKNTFVSDYMALQNRVGRVFFSISVLKNPAKLLQNGCSHKNTG